MDGGPLLRVGPAPEVSGLKGIVGGGWELASWGRRVRVLPLGRDYRGARLLRNQEPEAWVPFAGLDSGKQGATQDGSAGPGAE